MISVTLQFSTIAEAAAAMCAVADLADRLSLPLIAGDCAVPLPVLVSPAAAVACVTSPLPPLLGEAGYQIPFNDRPDVGAPQAALPSPAEAPAAPGPAEVFGSAAAPAPFLSVPSAAAPVAAPTAPTPPALPVAAPGAAPTLDKDGVPWDGRIHGSTKSLNADGTWRRKRNTADAEFEAVKASLLQATAAQVAAPATPPDATPITFGQLAMKYTPAIISKALPDATVAATLAFLGLTAFNQLMHAPALVPIVDAEWAPLVGLPMGAPA